MPRPLLLLIVSFAIPAFAGAADPDLKLLFLGDQKNHKPATRFQILQPVMEAKGVELTYTEDVSRLNLDTLNQYDGLVLFANLDQIKPDQAKVLLDNSSPAELIAALKNSTMQVRLHAQRLLVERANADVVSELISLVQDKSVDAPTQQLQ